MIHLGYGIVNRATYSLKLHGNFYSTATLLSLSTDELPIEVPPKDFNVAKEQYLVCEKVLNFARIFHQVKHFRKTIFDMCSQKVLSC